jgi:hypothetical protein
VEDRDRDRVVVEGWATGMTVREMATMAGRSAGWVSTRARRLGLPPRREAFSEREAAAAIAAYQTGNSLTAVAAQLDRSVEAVRAALVRAGVVIIGAADRSRRWPVNHRAFSSPLSSEAWYWLGFLAADGSVAGTRVSLGLSPSSEPALQRFGRFMGCPEKPLRTAAKGRQLVLDVHSSAVARDLALHGIRPRKTWDLKVSAAAAREHAFWLGYLDGDGCVVISPGGVPKLHFVGTRALMEQCATFLAAKVLTRRPSVHIHSARSILWTVAVSGDNARRLAEGLLLAHDDSLEAKRAKLEAASRYTSRLTRTRTAVRTKRCSWCGAWITRFPSQMRGERVFCNSSHFGKWNARHRGLAVTRRPGIEEATMAAPGAIAQLGERLTGSQEAGGSSPPSSTSNGGPLF